MANHGVVKTKKKMTPEKVSEVLNRLNSTLFKNTLNIEYSFGDDPARWGDHMWIITPKNSRVNEFIPVWLETSRTLESAHKMRSSFMWWVWFAIANEMAIVFNGTVQDEADDEKEPGISGKYNDYHQYLARVNTLKDGNKLTDDPGYRLYVYLGTPQELLPDDLMGKDVEQLVRKRWSELAEG